MTKKRSNLSTHRLTESEAIAYWEKLDKEFLDRMRASGRTVTETEPSDTTGFKVSFPQGRRPVAKRRDLRQAYLSALYEFELNGRPCAVRVGEQNAAVADFLTSQNADGAAFITAYNPASLDLGSVHNQLADRALISDLRAENALIFPGVGRDPQGTWLPEKSHLVVGIDRGVAENLARRYGQYAMLWIDAAGHVALVELEDLDKANRYPLKNPPFAWVELGFAWGYEWASLRMTPSKWRRILEGERLGMTTREGNDGTMFTLSWSFRHGTDLDVGCGGDGGTAFDGKLSGVTLKLGARG